MAQFRKQMLALSSCHMTLAMATANGTTQIDAKPIDAFQAWHTSEDGQQTLWPGYIRLTDKFYESLVEHAVPLQPEAIGQLQNSAFALDVYSWLAHRLCRINNAEGVRLSWAALKSQFGQEYGDNKNFRRKLLEALHKATAVYKDARLEIVQGGLRLHASPPPVGRRSVGVKAFRARLPRSEPPPPPPEDKVVPVRIDALVSEYALAQVPAIAPGWDKYFLKAKYESWVQGQGEMPRHPDAAFLGWVKRFTKGKRP